MRKPILVTSLLLPLLAASGSARAAYSSGSDGSGGELVVSANQTLQLPEDGVLRYTTITINGGATLTLLRNARNTPAHLLATGDVTLGGIIEVSGGPGTTGSGGRGGPGGFDGGQPTLGDPAPGDGHGPGAGLGARSCRPVDLGAGAYSKRHDYPGATDGMPYGNPLLSTLVGGSGGGGCLGSGGGGGGGAILIASDTKIVFFGGAIRARGGGTADGENQGGGSGGAIRLVAPFITGAATLDVGSLGDGRLEGRVRVDALDFTGFAHACCSPSAWSVGSFMRGYTPPVSRLDIVEVAGQAIPIGSSAVQIELPSGTPPLQTVTVRAAGFVGVVPVEIVAVPDSGPTVKQTVNFDMSQGDPLVLQTTITLPVNVACRLHAWAR